MANPDRQTDLNGQQDAVGRLPTELHKRHPTPAGFSATGELERRSSPQRRLRTVAGDAVAFVVPGDDLISRGKQSPQLLRRRLDLDLAGDDLHRYVHLEFHTVNNAFASDVLGHFSLDRGEAAIDCHGGAAEVACLRRCDKPDCLGNL